MVMSEEQRRRVEGSYTGETGGGTSWTPKRYRAPKRIKPPKVFSSDVKTQNRWVENVTSPVVDRVAKFNSDRPVTLDDIEALPLGAPLPRVNSPRSVKALLELGVDPEGYDLEPVNIEDHRDDHVAEPIWMLRYEHAVKKRENLLKSLQDLRHAITERDAINEFRPAKGKMAHVESTVIAAAESKSIQISSERMDRFHEKTRNWQQTHANNLAMEIQRVKNSERKVGESEEYIQGKLQEKRDREIQRDKDNWKASQEEIRRLREEKAKRDKENRELKRRNQEIMNNRLLLERQRKRDLRDEQDEKERQRQAFKAQTKSILDWQQAKIDAKKRSMEEEEERRAELNRIKEEHRQLMAKAAADDFKAKMDEAKGRADDILFGRIHAILDKEDQRQRRQEELDATERAEAAEQERQRLEDREAHRQHTYNEAVRIQREREDRIKAEAEHKHNTMEEHMAALNFHRKMTQTERQLAFEDRKFKAEQKAKRDALQRFKLKQKIERETAKAEHIKMMREQMRQDAIRTNMEEAERHRREKEAARKALHHSYAAEAVPHSFTRNSKVYGKKALGRDSGGSGVRSGRGSATGSERGADEDAEYRKLREQMEREAENRDADEYYDER